MYSVKTNVLELTALMKQHGITRAVLSPGSRNSPLNHTLASCPDILCTPVTDERSAAFTANGLCAPWPRAAHRVRRFSTWHLL